MIRRRTAREDGWALVIALTVLLCMMIVGLSAVAMVDTQGTQSGNERVRESSFNLAEGVLNNQAFVLSRNWRGPASANLPACSSDTAPAATCPDPAWLAGQFSSTDYATGSGWTVRVMDNGGTSQSYYQEGVTNAAGVPARDLNNDERVCDRPVGDEHGDLIERDKAHGGVLCSVEDGRLMEVYVAREKGVNPVVLNRRVGSCAAEQQQLRIRFITRLFEQLARGGTAVVLAVVNHATRNFQRHLAGAVPVLFDHHYFVVRRQRHDVDPVGRFDHIEIVFAPAAWIDAQITPHLKHATVGDLLALNATPRGGTQRRLLIFHAHTCSTSTRGTISLFGISAGQ